MKPIEKWFTASKQIEHRLRVDNMSQEERIAASRVQWALYPLAHNKETLQQDKDVLLAAVIEAQILWPERH